MSARSSPDGYDVAGLLALRSVGLVAGLPIRVAQVVVVAPVVDITGLTASGRNGRPARVTSVVSARKRLLERIAAEARERDAVGVVGVEFAEADFAVQPSAASGAALEVSATALPVLQMPPTHSSATGTHRAWFRTTLGPIDVAALLRGGWVPVEVLVLGTVLTRATRHRAADARVATSRANNEIAGATDLIQRARRQLRNGFRQAADALGADGVLMHGDFAVTWSSTYHLVEVSATATAIARWSRPTPRVSLSPSTALPLVP